MYTFATSCANLTHTLYGSMYMKHYIEPCLICVSVLAALGFNLFAFAVVAAAVAGLVAGGLVLNALGASLIKGGM